MRKIVLFSLILISGLLTSCASIPGKVKPGDTLVIGKVEVKAHDFKYSEKTKIDLNATYKQNITLTVKNVVDGKEVQVQTNEDGFFFLKGLKAHNLYYISKVNVAAYSMSGWQTNLFVNLGNSNSFVAYDNQVINLGSTYYDVDGIKQMWSWQISNYYIVKEYFKELSKDSEWGDKNIVEWRY